MKKVMSLLIAGSRGITQAEFNEAIKYAGLDAITVWRVVTGGAVGADTFAEKYAAKRGIKTLTIKPDWDGQGKKAGFLRNEELVKAATHALFVWDGESNGTRHTISLVEAADMPYLLFIRNKQSLDIPFQIEGHKIDDFLRRVKFGTSIFHRS